MVASAAMMASTTASSMSVNAAAPAWVRVGGLGRGEGASMG